MAAGEAFALWVSWGRPTIRCGMIALAQAVVAAVALIMLAGVDGTWRVPFGNVGVFAAVFAVLWLIFAILNGLHFAWRKYDAEKAIIKWKTWRENEWRDVSRAIEQHDPAAKFSFDEDGLCVDVAWSTPPSAQIDPGPNTDD